MELTELGALGELVGGIAVIASLLYLGLQVRESRKTAEAANNQAQADAHTAYLTAIASDPTLSSAFKKIFRDATEGDPLTPEEEMRMVPLLHTAFSQFQIGFYSYEQGLIRRGWRDHLGRALQGWLKAPYVRRWWTDDGEMFASEFRAHVDGVIAVLAE